MPYAQTNSGAPPSLDRTFPALNKIWFSPPALDCLTVPSRPTWSPRGSFIPSWSIPGPPNVYWGFHIPSGYLQGLQGSYRASRDLLLGSPGTTLRLLILTLGFLEPPGASWVHPGPLVASGAFQRLTGPHRASWSLLSPPGAIRGILGPLGSIQGIFGILGPPRAS